MCSYSHRLPCPSEYISLTGGMTRHATIPRVRLLLQASLWNRRDCSMRCLQDQRRSLSRPGPAASASCRPCTCAARTCRLPGKPFVLSGMLAWYARILLLCTFG